MNQAATAITSTITDKNGELFVPLGQLVLSPHNMRTPDMNERELDELGASILAHGLIQNLSVHVIGECKKTKKKIYGACVGGNRLYAMNRLLAAGKITAEYPVRTAVVDEKKALEISLAENMLRKAPHVVDQFYAFQRLIEQGEHVDDVAAVFGVSPVVVKRSLALAKLAPSLVEKCRQDEIKYSQLQVLTLLKTHAEQIEFWENLEEYQRDADTMRDYLTNQRIDTSTNPLALFVGVKAYIDAGGPVENDLFNDSDNAGFMLDAALLDSLVLDKLEESADEFRLDGWAWVETTLEFSYQDKMKYGRAEFSLRDMTDVEIAQKTKLDGEKEILQANDEWSDEEDERWEEIREEEAAINEALRTYDAETKAIAGVMLTVSENGTLHAERGLIRRTEKPAEKNTALHASEQEQIAQPDKAKPTSDYSEAMYRRLSAQRTRALQAGVAGNPSVALALLAYRLGVSLLYPRQFISCSAQIRIESTDLTRDADDIESNAGSAMLAAASDAIKAQIPKKVSAFLPWLLEQPATVITDILAYCTALSINDIHGNDGRNGDVDTLAQAVGLNMADYWTATASSFFNHVTKRHALDALKTVSKKAAEECADLKKDALAREAEKQLADKHWLPKVLQFKRKK